MSEISRSYSVANVCLRIEDGIPWALDSAQDFRAEAGSAACDIGSVSWTLRRAALSLDISKQDILFDSAGSWSAFRGDSAALTDFILFNVDGNRRTPQARMCINDNTNSVLIHWDDQQGFTFPFDELFFINAFSLMSSVLIHSLSVVHNNQGYIFCGVSGAGKSTLGKILEDRGYTYLCDERNAISFAQGKCLMHSTPFYGTSEKAFRGQAPLKAIVVLDPSHKGASLSPVLVEDVIASLYPTLFLPQYSRDKIEKSLATFTEIAAQTPIYRLNYDKSKVDICDFLQAELFSQG